MNFSIQREEILNYLKNSKEHPTAEHIYSHLKDKLPNLSLATVYRNCNKLCEMGELVRLKTDGKTDRFDADLSNHQHFVCVSCGKMHDLYFAIPDELFIEHLPKGFTKDVAMLYVYGLCDCCKK